ncbi:hypothetical protein [Limnochorda pilosa]|uniref:Uncharacterized protein n=1 Tax=Limnochorda pilosa TaxID=1555112 RepID=A0A0K2SIG8_LIMPI|nr:hypothetical protein [Limnochorda pilosa]BAS26921.1 hypothetical protein LIP_1064 [Limnochorda pilosa]
MSLGVREFWGVVHGMGLGALFLLAFAGGLAGLYSLRPELVTVDGIRERIRRLNLGTTVMAVVAWLTVISGTYVVYPWYRAQPPEGADLSGFPRSLLLSDPSTASWHRFGMEWKEHVAWFAPILATAVAYVVWKYGDQLVKDERLRKGVMIVFILAFATAAVAGLFGALITKVAPVI